MSQAHSERHARADDVTVTCSFPASAANGQGQGEGRSKGFKMASFPSCRTAALSAQVQDRLPVSEILHLFSVVLA